MKAHTQSIYTFKMGYLLLCRAVPIKHENTSYCSVLTFSFRLNFVFRRHNVARDDRTYVEWNGTEWTVLGFTILIRCTAANKQKKNQRPTA